MNCSSSSFFVSSVHEADLTSEILNKLGFTEDPETTEIWESKSGGRFRPEFPGSDVFVDPQKVGPDEESTPIIDEARMLGLLGLAAGESTGEVWEKKTSESSHLDI